MYSVFLLGGCSFVLSFALTPLLRDLAIRLGCVDCPDNDRKLHKVAVPRIGGIPILLAYIGAFAILLLFDTNDSAAVHKALPLVWKLLPAALLVFFTGVLDDLFGLKPWQKLLGQTAAGVVACLGGLRIEGFVGHELSPVMGVPLTIVWLVACSNAFNLIDGVDGVASGIGFLATVTMLIAGLLSGDTGLVMATAPLAGALFAFLRFNFNPASIFLGDCGSLSIGFMLGCFGVIWFHKAATILGISAPLMALSIPLLDTSISIMRRFLNKEPIFRPDRNHIHHRLLDRGLTPRRVALLFYGAGSLAAAFSLLQSTIHNGASGMITALFCGSVWFGIQSLGYREFRVVSQLMRDGCFRTMVRHHLSLDHYRESLAAAMSVEECWRVVQSASREFGFAQVSLRMAGRSFQEQFDGARPGGWYLHIPLSDSEYLQLTHAPGSAVPTGVVAPLAECLRRELSRKATELGAAPKMAPSKTASAPSSAYA
jgi:UDP-GlcNAc:undecaprenyl-phosphate/decaprenyl-phosphate GlcNAc-1-phosphate transferase